MKTDNSLLFDIVCKKKKYLTSFLDELTNSIDKVDESKVYIYEAQILDKKEDIEFLTFLLSVFEKEEGLRYLKNYLKDNKVSDNRFNKTKLSKYKIVKELIREYTSEYRKNYFNNKYVGITGIFDNELFCSIIRKRIDKMIYCNDVTKAKYKHLVAFLNELLHEMENSKNPLKTLKYKMKLYQKYRKTECVEIRKRSKAKIEIVKEILQEYNKEKNIKVGCK